MSIHRSTAIYRLHQHILDRTSTLELTSVIPRFLTVKSHSTLALRA